jgi:Carboxypeptidase regulatory-like domain
MTNTTLYHRSLLCLCLTAVLVAPRHAIAQVLYGSIVGNVRDASEAPVPNAEVTATDRETNQSRQTVTNESGGYTFATLPSGTYDVKVSHPGFQIANLKEIGVTINSVARADVKLAVGAVTESIQVTADSLALQTDRSEVRAEVTAKTLVNLPVPLGRNYQNLFVTIPGFTPPANAHSIPSNPSRALVFNVNGTSRSSNNVRLDGASSTNIWLPHVSAYVPALEAIETVNVVTNSFDAEQGLAGGAAINVQIKSGTNNLHGSAFEYHNDNNLNAKPFFTPAGERNPKRVQPVRRHRRRTHQARQAVLLRKL